MTNGQGVIKAVFQVNLIVSHKNNKPCLEIRRVTADTHLIKEILLSAFHNKPIIIQPVFTNRIKSMTTLIDKGIIYLENNEYFFTI